MDKYWIAILPTLTVIGRLAYWGMKNYIGEKLKNIATHEDIGKITNEVESVKQIFTTQTEKLKQELSVLTNKHNVFFNEEKEALVAYMSSWNVWFGGIRIILNDYNENNYLATKDLKPIFKKDFDKMQISMFKVELFVNNNELIKLIVELNQETYKLEKINLAYTHKIYVQCYYIIKERKKLNDVFANQELPKKEIQRWHTELASIIFDNNQIIPSFYQNINKFKKEFIKLSKAYIRRGVNEEYSN